MVLFRSANLGQMQLKELAEKSGGGEKLRFLNKKCMAPAKKLYTFYYFPAQVVDLRSWSSSEVNFVMAHQIISKVQSHVGSSVGIPSHHPRPAVTLRNKARSAFQHNVFSVSLSCDLFMITFNLNVYIHFHNISSGFIISICKNSLSLLCQRKPM